MNVPMNGESNKGLINETAKPSKYFPSSAMIWFVCERGFIWWGNHGEPRLGVVCWEFALSLLGPMYLGY